MEWVCGRGLEVVAFVKPPRRIVFGVHYQRSNTSDFRGLKRAQHCVF